MIDRLLAARKLEASLREAGVAIGPVCWRFLDKVPPDMDVNSILQRAETNRSLHFQRARLRRDMAELNTLFWFVDEEQWPAKKELCLNRG